MNTVETKIHSADIIKALNNGFLAHIDNATTQDFILILSNAKAICEEKIKEGETLWYWNDELYQVDSALKSLQNGTISQSRAK
jgi:hypothetical protein